MLKAYSYIENAHLDSGIIDRHILAREKQIISEFTVNNPTPKIETPCVICGGVTKEFAVIDEICYQRCNYCRSIFAKVENETIERYKAYQPLVDFRSSGEYQSSAAERREGIWEDLLFWLKYRLARYMRKNSELDVIDIDNRYCALAEKIKHAGFCGGYNITETADVVLFLEQFRCLPDPTETLSKLRRMLNDNGILVMNMRVGGGFDVLTLKGCTGSIFPYETILLPSTEGLGVILKNTGFDVLEVSTPGALDIEHVLQNKEHVDEDDLFVNYLLSKTDKSILAEFQRFLQKSGMSSHARVIARKRPV